MEEAVSSCITGVVQAEANTNLEKGDHFGAQNTIQCHQALGSERDEAVAREQERRQPDLPLDEEDVAEMSKLAAQIESAEEFNLTFEFVDTSASEDVENKVIPKRRRSKTAPNFFTSDEEDIEEFINEGLSQSILDEPQEEKANISVAESLLEDWNASKIELECSSTVERLKENFSKNVKHTSTPARRLPLKELDVRTERVKSEKTSKKRVSFPSTSDENSPVLKRKVRSGLIDLQ